MIGGLVLLSGLANILGGAMSDVVPLLFATRAIWAGSVAGALFSICAKAWDQRLVGREKSGKWRIGAGRLAGSMTGNLLWAPRPPAYRRLSWAGAGCGRFARRGPRRFWPR